MNTSLFKGGPIQSPYMMIRVTPEEACRLMRLNTRLIAFVQRQSELAIQNMLAIYFGLINMNCKPTT